MERGITFMGERIYRCERVEGEHAGRWIVQTYHSTGLPYADELCPHYRRLADAKDYIREDIAYLREFRQALTR